MRAAWTSSMLFALLIGQGSAVAGGFSWLASYPYGQAPSQKLIAAGLALGYLENTAGTGSSPTGNSAVTSEHPLGSQSAITQTHPIAPENTQPAWWTKPTNLQQPPIQSLVPPLAPGSTPWYDTLWGVAGIGVAATGATMFLDHGINHYVETHLSYSFRNHVPLNIADVLTDSSVIFAGTTWFQSPWASPKLAHASSVALTATAITTAEVFLVKYAVGRARPGGPNSSSTHYTPFSSQYRVMTTSFLFNNHGGPTASFPSGHTAVAFSIITPYAQIYHQPWLYTIPFAVGISRILAQDGHWASDVVAGGFVGWLTADLTNRYFAKSDYGFMIFGDGVGLYGKF
ncbi:phosphoesterase PA-phosphatase related protein [Acidithiobacillus ferrivorans SS3]|uniref:Phosphoesterase PA-phosphatase related protein n=1 Tax=Acidithiobacillus ferrivorans SS3 TaxID=743299 RepID=G0JPB0_9PROT|nr:phosphatase PAP2 family protein [Acidithiobacillus ferrivorans]AEM47341.1 phosphoesterase PA-phosphatase related protein [Acidithiobacillus ferrivorans SS3]